MVPRVVHGGRGVDERVRERVVHGDRHRHAVQRGGERVRVVGAVGVGAQRRVFVEQAGRHGDVYQSRRRVAHVLILRQLRVRGAVDQRVFGRRDVPLHAQVLRLER